jgi:biopolymer transport protein ExbD
MAMGTGTADGEPIGTMNTTPLIDVMLVLLVMFIITVPLQTHAVKVTLPVGAPQSTVVRPAFNTVSVTPQNAVTWNGKQVDLATLRRYLDLSRAMAPEPQLRIQPDAYARYAAVDEMLAVVKRAQVTNVGFVENERYAQFAK